MREVSSGILWFMSPRHRICGFVFVFSLMCECALYLNTNKLTNSHAVLLSVFDHHRSIESEALKTEANPLITLFVELEYRGVYLSCCL